MEQPGVVAGNFGPSYSLNFLSIFVHISGSFGPIILIWASLERSFPNAEVEYGRCQFWSKVMTSEVEEMPSSSRAVTGSTGVNGLTKKIKIQILGNFWHFWAWKIGSHD